MQDVDRRQLGSIRQLLSDPPLNRRGTFYPFKVPAVTAGNNFTWTIDGGYWERLLALSFSFTASATPDNRAVTWQLTDGDGAIFNQVQVLPLVTASQTATGVLDFTIPVTSQTQESNSVYGTQTSPAALTTIATTPRLFPGAYQLSWIVELQGTVAAGVDNDNFGFYSGATQLFRSVNPAAVGSYQQETTDFIVTTAGQYTLKNIAAATAGAVYSGELVITPIDQIFGEGQLPDETIPAGWSWSLQVSNIQAADQLTAVNFIIERYASDFANGGEQLEREAWLRRIIREELADQWNG